MKYPISRWWGWGDADEEYSLKDRPHLRPFLQSKLGLPRLVESPPPALNDISLPSPGLGSEVKAELVSLLSAARVSLTQEDRLRHALGRSYRDLLALRLNRVPHAPDAVVFPQNEDEVAALMNLAAGQRLGLVPVGGATSVVGGVEPVRPEGFTGVISLDLTLMNKVLDINAEALTATVEAGILGRDLEVQLNAQELSLGHFPESFHFSTLGGWIAAASAGQNSTLYGRMADLVLGLRLVSPAGVIDTDVFPAHAQGPDLKRLLIGSEGVLGVITQATLRLHPQPQAAEFRAFLFRDFASAAKAAQGVMRAGLTPAVIRVSDGPETDMALALLREPRGWMARATRSQVMAFLSARGYRSGARSLMILGLEGNHRLVKAQKKEALGLIRRDGGFNLGRQAGSAWAEGRFDQPYLRDRLMNMGLLVDTLETVTLWPEVLNLHQFVTEACGEAMAGLGSPGLVLAHLSHLYPQGSSLYFILICPRSPGREMEQWRIIKTKATEAIISHQGALSHHHGVGLDHALWLSRCLGPARLELLKKLKMALDAPNIMNPGKLFYD